MALFCSINVLDDEHHEQQLKRKTIFIVFKTFFCWVRAKNQKIMKKSFQRKNFVSDLNEKILTAWLLQNDSWVVFCKEAAHNPTFIMLFYLSLASTNLQSVLTWAKNGKKELYLLFYFNWLVNLLSSFVLWFIQVQVGYFFKFVLCKKISTAQRRMEKSWRNRFTSFCVRIGLYIELSFW